MSTAKTAVFWIVIIAAAFLLWQIVKTGRATPTAPEISYSEFLARVASGQVAKVIITGSEVSGFDTRGGGFRVIAPQNQSAMLDTLQQRGVEVWFRDISGGTWPSFGSELYPARPYDYIVHCGGSQVLRGPQ
jgi:cell division protease FtsH